MMESFNNYVVLKHPEQILNLWNEKQMKFLKERILWDILNNWGEIRRQEAWKKH